MPAEGRDGCTYPPRNCDDDPLHRAHDGRQHLLEPFDSVGGFCQKPHDRKKSLGIGRSEGRTIDQNEVLRHVPLGSIKSFGFYANNLCRQSARGGHTMIQNVAGNRGEPHNKRVASRFGKQSLSEFAWKVCINLEIARKAKKSKRWKNREGDRPSAGPRQPPRDMSLPSVIVTNSI
jgi:hypothetical protein